MQAIKDWHLFLVVTMFVTVDVFILIVATSLSATRLHPEIVPDKEFGNTTNVSGVNLEASGLYRDKGIAFIIGLSEIFIILCILAGRGHNN